MELGHLVFRKQSFVPTTGWLCPVNELPDTNSTASTDRTNKFRVWAVHGHHDQRAEGGAVAPNFWVSMQIHRDLRGLTRVSQIMQKSECQYECRLHSYSLQCLVSWHFLACKGIHPWPCGLQNSCLPHQVDRPATVGRELLQRPCESDGPWNLMDNVQWEIPGEIRMLGRGVRCSSNEEEQFHLWKSTGLGRESHFNIYANGAKQMCQ